jgi:hypothetical protein
MAQIDRIEFDSNYPAVLSAQMSVSEDYTRCGRRSDLYSIKLGPDIPKVGHDNPEWNKYLERPADRLRLVKMDRRDATRFYFRDGMLTRQSGSCLALDPDMKLVVRPNEQGSNCFEDISIRAAEEQLTDLYEEMIVTLQKEEYLLCPIRAGKNDRKGRKRKQKSHNIGEKLKRKRTKPQSKQTYQSPEVIYDYDIQVVPNESGSKSCEDTRFPTGLILLLKNFEMPLNHGDPPRLISDIGKLNHIYRCTNGQLTLN